MLLLEDFQLFRRIQRHVIDNKKIVHNEDVGILLTYYHDLKINKSDMTKRTVVTTETYLDKHPPDEEVLGELIAAGLKFIVYPDQTSLIAYV